MLRAVRTANLARKFLQANRLQIIPKATAAAADLGPLALRVPNLEKPDEKDLKEMIATWEEVSDIFFGPERDTKNFPLLKMKEEPGKTRMRFIPEEYFQLFYNKTGVLGPYILLLGYPMYFFSKEIWKFDFEIYILINFFILYPYLYKKLVNKDGRFMKHIDAKREESSNRWYGPLVSLNQNVQESIDDLEKKIWMEDGMNYLFEAKKENVDLQLEAAYRERLQKVYNDTKRRLDYQVEVSNAKKGFEQKQLASWVTDAVYKNITPQLEKQALANCLATLREMSKTQKASA